MFQNHSSLTPASTVSLLACSGNKPVVAGLIVMPEIWKPVRGYEGNYEVSNMGNIRSITRTVKCGDGRNREFKGQLVSPGPHPRGYLKVGLSKNGVIERLFVHRLVAEAFIPKNDECNIVNHIDGDKKNNHSFNLEWCTAQQNTDHAKNVLKRSFSKHPKP